ncbi:MAG: riboflavin biosynthesis protein RibF [Planctomycetota bacterium]
MTEIVPLADVTVGSLPRTLEGGAVSIGNFDGVHLGHAGLLGQVRDLAERLKGPSIACLFDPHPIAILRPEIAPQRLTTIEERARRMTGLGIEYLVVCQTTPELLQLSPTDFFEGLLRVNLRCRGLIEGENFRFGKARSGNVSLLKTLCEASGIEFRIADLRANQGEVISSTRVRELLSEGDVAGAARLMDAPHRIDGIVESGDRRGREIGFPTANVGGISVLLPQPGVYAGHAIVEGKTYKAAIHLGPSPTFASGSAAKVEAHLLNFDGDLYGRSLAVEFVDRIRGVRQFDSAKTLIEQLTKDVADAEQMLEGELT